jgi:hypothetical protein
LPAAPRRDLVRFALEQQPENFLADERVRIFPLAGELDRQEVVYNQPV